jgi:hypothetical protein
MKTSRGGSLPNLNATTARTVYKKRQKKASSSYALTTSVQNGNALTMVVEPWMPLFPARVVKTLRYSTTFALTSTSGVVTTYVFRANDLFDPDFTGSGHQPMGFDQMMLFFNHFVVTKARLRIVAKSTTTSFPATVAIRQDANSTAITVIDQIVEFGGLVSVVLEAAGSFGSSKELDLSCDISKLSGVNPQAMTANPSLQGNAAASPAEVTYLHVQMWDTGGRTCTAQFDAILEQEAWFLEPRDITQSLFSRQALPAYAGRTFAKPPLR